MAYVKNTWVDQKVERPKTYNYTNNDDGSMTLIDAFGDVEELGTPVNADNMNHIEDGLANVGIWQYKSNITYNKGDAVIAIEDDKFVLYKSLKDQNKGNALTNEDYWEKSELGSSGSGLEICDIGVSLYVDESKGLRRYLNGSVFYMNANTQVFLNKLKRIVALYPSLLDTEENWQAAKTLSPYGQVGKFVFNYDTDGTTVVSVRLPRVVNIQGLTDLSNLGLTVPAGLPTHTHTRGTMEITGSVTGGCANWHEETGAFTYRGTGGTVFPGNGRAVLITTANFTASNTWTGSTSAPDNSIYGNSDTVQPEAVQFPYFIQVATGAEESDKSINNYQVNNVYAYGMSIYYKGTMNNSSWLRSAGQWNSGTVYNGIYNWIVEQVNDGVNGFKGTTGYAYTSDTVSTTWYVISTEAPKVGQAVYGSTGSYLGNISSVVDNKFTFTRNDTSVTDTFTRDSSRDITANTWLTDYDWVINTEEQTFRLPLLDGSENLLSSKYDDMILKKSGSTYVAPANGWFYINKTGGSADKYINLTNLTSNISTGDTTYGTAQQIQLSIVAQKGDIIQIDYDATGATNKFRFIYAQGNGNLYYYIGDTLQNADLINIARLGEELVDIKADKLNKADVVAYVIETYVNGASGYRIWSDKYCEQWGYLAMAGAGTVTFLKPFKDTAYSFTSMPVGTIGNNYFGIGTSQHTASTVLVTWDGGEYDASGIYWRCCGYLA